MAFDIMPGTSMYALDNTDVESLLSYIVWNYKQKQGGATASQNTEYVDGKPYERKFADQVKW